MFWRRPAGSHCKEDGAPAARIAAQTRKCPSGALNHAPRDAEDGLPRETQITVSMDGPERVSGDGDLQTDVWGDGATRDLFALCRCGGSKNKPFCDETHWYNGFKDDRN